MANDGMLVRILEHAVAIGELGYRLADWSDHVARIVVDRELAPPQT